MPNRSIITLTTDFGLNDHFVGTVKGVILNIVPDAQIVDICHSVQAFDVLDGALTIAQSYSYLPSGTVHWWWSTLESERRGGRSWSPATGIILSRPTTACSRWSTAEEERLHIRHVTAEHYSLQPVSNTFHARDILLRSPPGWPRGSIPKNLATRLPTLCASTRPSRNPWTAIRCAESC